MGDSSDFTNVKMTLTQFRAILKGDPETIEKVLTDNGPSFSEQDMVEIAIAQFYYERILPNEDVSNALHKFLKNHKECKENQQA